MNDYRKVTDRIYPSDKCREEVMNMRSENNRKRIKHRHTGKAVAAIAIAVVAVCGGTVAAASRLGAFDRLTDLQERTPLKENYDFNEYEKIAPHSVTFEEVSHAGNDCFTADLDSVYFDGLELILGFSGKMGNGNPGITDLLRFTAELEINGEKVAPIEGNRIQGSESWFGQFVLDEGTENSFSGSLTCVLPYNSRFDGTAEVTVRIDHIWSHYVPAGIQSSGLYEIMPVQSGRTLDLSANVTADTSLVRQINKTAEKDGFYFTVYSISPAMMLCHGGYPESYDIAMREEIENGTEDGYCHAVHPLVFVFDEDGNYIEGLPMNPIDMPDGEWASACVSTDSKTLTIKVGDKNCQSNENGSVEFDDQYGHQSFGYITEFTLDLDE